MWSVGAPVRYVRMVGGPEGHESLLAGLKDGTVLHISIDRQEPISQLRHSAPVRCAPLALRYLRPRVRISCHRIIIIITRFPVLKD